MQRVLTWILIVVICLDLTPATTSQETEPDISELNARAVEFYEAGDYQAALDLAVAALAAAEGKFGPENPYTLIFVNNLAFFYEATGRYRMAEPLYRRALEARERVLGPEHSDTLTSVNNLAALFHTTGRYREAEPLYRRALEGNKRELGSEHPETLVSVNNLASFYQDTGRHGEAEPLYRRAFAARERTLGPEHPDTLISVNNLASLYKATGRYGEAEPLYRRALATRERVLGPEHPDTLTSVNNLALLYQATGRSREAEPLYRRATKGSERALGPEHPDTLSSVNNLGYFYEATGRYDEAEPLYRRTLATRERVLGSKHPDTLRSINNLAALYQTTDRYREAEPLYRRALEGFERVLGLEHPDTLDIANNLTLLYLSKPLPDFEAAAALLTRSLEGGARRLQRELLAGGSEDLQKALIGEVGARDLALTFAVYPEGDDALGARALLLTKAMAGEINAALSQVIATSDDPASRKLADDLQQAESALVAAGFANDPDRIAQARSKRDDLFRDLLARESNLTSIQEPERIDPEAIQQVLDPDTILLDFAIFNPVDFFSGDRLSEYVARLIYRPGSAPQIDDLGPYSAIADDIERLSSIGVLHRLEPCLALAEADRAAEGCPSPELLDRLAALFPEGARDQSAFANPSLRLSKVLLSGVDPGRQANRLVIAPDGALHRINFSLLSATLPLPLSILETHELQIVPSLRVLLPGPAGNTETTAGFFAAGGADYGPVSANATRLCSRELSRGSGGFCALPHAQDEVRALTDLLTGSGESTRAALTGAQANEAEVVANMPNTRIVHLATHAGHGLSEGKTGIFDVALAFSGANSALEDAAKSTTAPGNDGLLWGAEILRLPLFGTDLVTLSACDTALGSKAGTEGYYSLAYAFRLAGAENVLMSLWKVDDEKTRIFMEMLYTRWAQKRLQSPEAPPGQTLRNALRQTMLDAKKDPKSFKLRHYAAFVLLEN